MAKYLVLGGDGALVNALSEFLPGDTIIAGRRVPRSLRGQRFIRFDALADGPAALVERLGPGADVVINAIGGSGSNLRSYGLNVSAATTAVEISRRLGARLLQMSTLKCDRRVFSDCDDASAFPYSPYAWSKLCAELAVERDYQHASILRLAYVDHPASAHYYRGRITVDRVVKTVTPATIWKHIVVEGQELGFRTVEVHDGRDHLPTFMRRIGRRSLVVAVPLPLLRTLRKHVSSKIFDYVPDQ